SRTATRSQLEGDAMPDRKDPNNSPPRSKKKFKQTRRAAPSGRLRMALLIGGGVVGLLVAGLASWGVVSLFGGGTIVAKARPAEMKLPSEAFPLDQVPSASAGWKVTPDGLPRAPGLPSASPLPKGTVSAVLSAPPARARGAALTSTPPPRADPRRPVDFRPADPGEWVQVDLKGGQVVGRTPVDGVRSG